MVRTFFIGGLIAVAGAMASFWLLSIYHVPPQESRNEKENQAQQTPYVTKAATAGDDASSASASESPKAIQNVRMHTQKAVDVEAKSFDHADTTYPIRTYAPLATPNDPYANQWWTSSAGMSTLWDSAQPAGESTVAVIDTGFALAHEDLKDRWYVSPGESGEATDERSSKLNCTDRGLALNMACNQIDDDRDGVVDNESGAISYENPSQLNCTDQGRPLTKDCNLIDDDGNGFIDDVTGWDFMNFDRSVQAGETNPYGSGTTHGTVVAGIAGATAGNGKGIVGVDSDMKILPLQAIDDDSYGDTISVGDAMYYAISQGVDVISISLGSELPDEYVRGAVQEALKQGIVVVAAAGNDGCDCMVYPARYPEVIAVGALASDGVNPAAFSSYGANLDVLAPGENMTSTTWTSGNEVSAYAQGVNGTSFATPFVAGLISRLQAENTALTPQQLTALVGEQTTRTGLSATQARTNTRGYGIAHVGRSLQRLVVPTVHAQQYVFRPVHKGSYLGLTEKNGSYATYKCAHRPGATPMYSVVKGADSFTTISEAERAKAHRSGYTSSLLGYACVAQPGDSASAIRQIDVFREFKNASSKER